MICGSVTEKCDSRDRQIKFALVRYRQKFETRDVARLIGCEESNRFSSFIRISELAQRHIVREFLFHQPIRPPVPLLASCNGQGCESCTLELRC